MVFAFLESTRELQHSRIFYEYGYKCLSPRAGQILVDIELLA